MTPETFLKEFGTIASAPGGVQRLREMILQLAVMGTLVAQNPEDEPANELLEKIAIERKTLIHEKVIKKHRKFDKILNSEIPFNIPDSWEWIRLSDVGFDWGQTQPDKKITYIDVGAINQKRGEIENPKVMDGKEAPSRARKIVKKGTVIYSTVRPYLLNISVIQKEYCPEPIASTAFAIIHPFNGVSSSYLHYYLRSQSFQTYVENCQTGIAYPAINDKHFFSGVFPLPPLAEQKRIVAKVDQLMALCDRLEAQQQKRATLVKQARISALDELANAQGKEALQTSWKRVQTHLSMLFDHPDDVEDLKKCILQNAVMGKLVPQNPNDEPASELLKKIAEEKADLIKKGQIKRQKPLPKIRETEKPFDIPEGWVWARFSEIGELARGKSKHRPRNDIKLYQNGTIPLVQTGDVARSNGIVKTYTARYNQVGLKQSRLWPKGTLCITIAANIADTGILSFDACFPDSVVGFIPLNPDINIEYFDFYIRTAKQNLESYAPSTAQKNINLGILNKLLIPLPPEKELGRIVLKVKRLLSFCDNLKEQYEKSQTLAEQLAQSIVETITGQSTEKTKKMKAPKTELVSRLKLVKKPGAKVHAPLSAILVKNNEELSAKTLWNTSGLAIDDFYRQLKTEMVNGWIAEPEKAHVRIIDDQGTAQ